MMTKNRYPSYGIFVLSMVSVFFISGCIQQINNKDQTSLSGEKLEGQDCSADSECKSGVCNFIKQNMGNCVAVSCVPESQAQGISDISFFCDPNNQWQKIKGLGEKCDYDYECFRRTGKDCPTCHPEDYSYYCKNNICVEEEHSNECEKQGLKRITSKEDSDNNGDGSCFPTTAQRREITVCAPCGNSVCDTELESKCNCPQDCK